MRQLFHPSTFPFLAPSEPRSDRRYLRIVLDKATDLPVGDSILAGGASDPYIVFRVGDHLLRSTVVVKSLNPSWRREQFEFVLTTEEISTFEYLEIQVKDHDMAKPDDHLGTLKLDISKWQGAATLADMAIQPYPVDVCKDYASQRVQPCVHLAVALLSEEEATNLIVMQIWEHERRGVAGGWSSSNLKGSDPAPWVNDSSPQTSGATFVEAVLDTPVGYKECGPWEFNVALGDAEGWVYAASFDRPWVSERIMTSNVRRRLWARQFRHQEASPARAATAAEDVQVPLGKTEGAP
ncbi:hypothetical protein DYB32_005891 [Aphanomyces invadans]|uniref:C2 domain-containing protein n=1 Tax=Aphanomyces invadans TaxID=157072 RepID=A0A3R6Y772_9STRA|nr:hypothetical protein DYB32_005891 [Aphanomyces invadans]